MTSKHGTKLSSLFLQEDVLQLVELSDYIRKDRRARIREIQYEREELNDRRRLTYDDHLVEREVIYDSRRRY